MGNDCEKEKRQKQKMVIQGDGRCKTGQSAKHETIKGNAKEALIQFFQGKSFQTI